MRTNKEGKLVTYDEIGRLLSVTKTRVIGIRDGANAGRKVEQAIADHFHKGSLDALARAAKAHAEATNGGRLSVPLEGYPFPPALEAAIEKLKPSDTTIAHLQMSAEKRSDLTKAEWEEAVIAADKVFRKLERIVPHKRSPKLSKTAE